MTNGWIYKSGMKARNHLHFRYSGVWVIYILFQVSHMESDDTTVLRFKNDGLLDVRYKGNWGGICYRPGATFPQFDDNAALVACRQMGFKSGVWSNNILTVEPSSLVLSNVTCSTGDETNFDKCILEPSTTTPCYLAVKVECEDDPELNGLLNATLLRGDKAHEGILQVTTKDGTKREVCYDSATTAQKVSEVVCKQMNYSGFEESTPVNSSSSTNLYNANCQGTEQTLAACTLPTATICSTGKVTYVQCKLDKATQHRFGVRLSSPTNSLSQGTVEVYQYGRWGVICDTYWDIHDAEVVCRELGYKSAQSKETGAKFGQGTGVVFWNKMQCNGYEPSIANCIKDVAMGTQTCDSANAAGVVCKTTERIYTINICSNGPKVLEAGDTMIQSVAQPTPFSYSKGQTCFLHLTSPTNFTVYIYKKMFEENHVEYMSFISAERNETLYGDDSRQGPVDFNSRGLTIVFNAGTASGSGVINIIVSVAALPPPTPTTETTTTNGNDHTSDPKEGGGSTNAGTIGGVVGVTIALAIVFAVGISLWLWRSGKCAGRRQDDNKMAVIGRGTDADVNTTPIGGEYENVGDPAYENSAFAAELPSRANQNRGTTSRDVVYENVEGIGFHGQNNISRAVTLEALPGGEDHGQTASETVGESLYARLEPVNRPEYEDFRSLSAEQLKPSY